MQPREHRVRLETTGIGVRIQECGEGPPVLFVHGASNSGASWAGLVARMGGFRCLVLDRPGCGLSDPLPARLDDVDRLATFSERVLVDVLDALDIDRCDVVCTSFGGYLTLRTAAAHPDRVGRIVEFGWMVGAPIERVPFVMRLASVPVVGRLLASIPPTEGVVRSMLRRIGLRQALEAGRVSPEMVACYLALLRDTRTMRNELDAGPRILTPLRGMSDHVLLPAALLASIGTPVHFLWGEEDPFGGADVARAFASQLPNAELELVPGAGHAVWLDDVERSAAVVRSFFAA